jgi:hypothetical protein
MKVVCIDDYNKTKKSKIDGITNHKIYDVIFEGYTFYSIIDDNNIGNDYAYYRFEELYLTRNKLIDKILEE